MNSNTLKMYQHIYKSYRGIVTTIVIVIIFVVFATATNYVSFRDQLIANEQEQLLAIAKSTAKQLEDFMDTKITDVTVLEQIIIDDYYEAKEDETLRTLISRSLDNYIRTHAGEVHQIRFYNIGEQLVYDTLSVDPIEQKYSVQLKEFDRTLLAPYIGDIYEIAPGELAIDIVDSIDVNGKCIGFLQMTMKIRDIYNLRVAEIRIGEKGYASVKDSNGVLIMHPNSDDIGKEVMNARRAQLPDQDWSELEALVKEQLKGVAGTGIYHSYWYYDESYQRIKKFTAFAPAFIGDGFWVVTVPKDYNELSDIASRYLYTNVILAGIIPLMLAVLLVFLANLKKNLQFLENEQKYIEEVELLNTELEKDIEERKVLEKALYASKERFKQLFNAGSDLIFVLHVSDDHRMFEIGRVNNIACKRLGLERSDIVGMDFRALMSEISDGVLENIVEQVEKGHDYIYETKLDMDGKENVPVEISAQIFTLEGQQMMMLMTRDITKKKEEEEILEKQRAMLIYKFRLVAMGEMIANIAHQWRQPLGRLSLMISNLKDAYIHKDLSEEYFNEVVDNSHAIIQDMSEIIDEFRYFFNPINEKDHFNPEGQIQTALEMIKDRVKIDEVAVDINNTANHTIYGYPNQFSQVVLNILNNSIDAMSHMHKEQRKIDIRIDWVSDNLMRICIRNNGEKMPEGMASKVFEPYFSTKRHKDGTGIGLYMTKMIIETNFNGTIRMENEEEWVMTEIIIPVNEGDIRGK